MPHVRTKKHVLFVDDEPNTLDGLRRALWKMRDEWDMEFVTGGAAALAALEQRRFDVIITDMRMPGMDGAQLLEVVRESHPDVVRLVLTGHADRRLAMRTVGTAHQFLAKPCDPDTLIAAVRRSCALRNVLDDDLALQAVAGIDSLPVLPRVYSELMGAVASESTSPAQIGRIISRDMGMTAKVLQLVNSAFFGLQRRVDDPAEAVFYLGLETVRGLVLSVGVFSEFAKDMVEEYAIEDLQEHCLRVGSLAKRIVIRQGCGKQLQDDSFIAGALHDVGTLILIANFPAKFRDVRTIGRERGITAVKAEREVLGVTHAQLGGYLLGLWGLPEPVVEAVAFHHCPCPRVDSGFCALTAVHVADALDHRGCDHALDGGCIDDSYIADLKLTSEVKEWQNLMAAPRPSEEESHAECEH